MEISLERRNVHISVPSGTFIIVVLMSTESLTTAAQAAGQGGYHSLIFLFILSKRTFCFKFCT